MRSLLRQKEQIIHRARIQGILRHPKARKINQVQKSLRRSDAKNQVMRSLKTKRSNDEQQLFWIAAAMQRLASSPNRGQYENRNDNSNNNGVLPIVMEALVHIYISRNEKEIRDLLAKRQPPRGEIKKLEAGKEKEMSEFEHGKGFLVPPFATTGDIQLSLEWLEAVIEYEESCINNIAVVDNETEETRRKNQVPRIPPAYVRRVSITTSKRGNTIPDDDFMELVNQLQTQDGIGEHLIEKNATNENNNNNEGGEQNDNEGNEGQFVDDEDEVIRDLADRKKKRRRFAQLKKFNFKIGGGGNNNNNDNDDDGAAASTSGSRLVGAKSVNAKDIAIAGLAKRVQEDKNDRDKRRKNAMKAARADSDEDEQL